MLKNLHVTKIVKREILLILKHDKIHLNPGRTETRIQWLELTSRLSSLILGSQRTKLSARGVSPLRVVILGRLSGSDGFTIPYFRLKRAEYPNAILYLNIYLRVLCSPFDVCPKPTAVPWDSNSLQVQGISYQQLINDSSDLLEWHGVLFRSQYKIIILGPFFEGGGVEQIKGKWFKPDNILAYAKLMSSLVT